jgi:hypothetical protein
VTRQQLLPAADAAAALHSYILLFSGMATISCQHRAQAWYEVVLAALETRIGSGQVKARLLIALTTVASLHQHVHP